MDRFAAITGRRYHLFEYEGAPDAERVLILMGSGAETARETVKSLRARGEKVGVVQVRLYRPFRRRPSAELHCPHRFAPMAVLEQTKETGAAGEPLYLDVVTALLRPSPRGSRPVMPSIIGGRYGMSSKDFTPAMAKAAFDELTRSATPQATASPSVSTTMSSTPACRSIPRSRSNSRDHPAVFYGLGADGTVGANKNSVKIIAEDAGLLCAGLLRLRLAQIRRADNVASAVRSRADPRALSDRLGRLRRLPPIRFPRTARCAAARRTRRGVPAEQPVSAPMSLGRTATRGAAADNRQAAALSSSSMHRRWRATGSRHASTPSCRPASSPSPACCRETGAMRHIKAAIRKTYGQQR